MNSIWTSTGVVNSSAEEASLSGFVHIAIVNAVRARNTPLIAGSSLVCIVSPSSGMPISTTNGKTIRREPGSKERRYQWVHRPRQSVVAGCATPWSTAAIPMPPAVNISSPSLRITSPTSCSLLQHLGRIGVRRAHRRIYRGKHADDNRGNEDLKEELLDRGENLIEPAPGALFGQE